MTIAKVDFQTWIMSAGFWIQQTHLSNRPAALLSSGLGALAMARRGAVNGLGPFELNLFRPGVSCATSLLNPCLLGAHIEVPENNREKENDLVGRASWPSHLIDGLEAHPTTLHTLRSLLIMGTKLEN
jgi:hypothetical protein